MDKKQIDREVAQSHPMPKESAGKAAFRLGGVAAFSLAGYHALRVVGLSSFLASALLTLVVAAIAYYDTSSAIHRHYEEIRRRYRIYHSDE